MNKTVAQDGLLAYTLQPQTREKLWQIERLIDIFCTAMRGKWNLVYADMLAGPGICVDSMTHQERLGSALIAVQRPEFSRLFINDASDLATTALRQRLNDQPEGRIQISTDDCNLAVEAAREFLYPASSRHRTLGLAVIDPSAYQMRFESIERLTSGGVKTDLMIVLMTSFMKRFLETLSFSEPLSHILREDRVAELIRRRRSGQRLTDSDFIECFLGQLNSIGYEFTGVSPANNSIGRPVYHVVYASRHKLGQAFYAQASSRRSDGQIILPLSV